MTIMMDMSSYVVESTPATDVSFADPLQQVDFGPHLELATQQHLLTLMQRYPALPVSLANADAEMFLQKMSAYQR
ncbi:MAG: hypothetical protein R8K20_02875 [Gallionellaceae bacterium]